MDKNRSITGVVFGAILIALGILFFLGRYFVIGSWSNLWPLIIIGAGLAFFIGMFVGGKQLGGLAVPGSIITVIGLILLYMNYTGQWEAWSFAWALIIFAVGLGVLINGYWSGQAAMSKNGLDTMLTGLALFLIFGVIMGFVFSVSGVAQWGTPLIWAGALVLLGGLLLIIRIVRVSTTEGMRTDFFWPILMIGGGVLAIMAYFKLLPVQNLWVLVNLWPVLLIVAGLGLLFRSASHWVGASLGVLVVAAMFAAIYAGPQIGLNAQPGWISNIGSIQFGDFAGESITGSGNVITEPRQVSNFDSVEFSIPGKLSIQQGSSESLTISAEDNIIPLLVTNVSGGTLTIRYKPGYSIHSIRSPEFVLMVKDLKDIGVSSSGSVSVRALKTGNLNLTISSSGSIIIDTLQANNITARISSSGDISLKGNANQLNLRISSSGDFQAADLQINSADVGISSSGNATLWVVKDLKANISSSGDVYYYGSPTVSQRITSSGKVVSRGAK
jgi:hypothetical protein